MEQDKYNLVRQIITSPAFQSYDKEQQNEVLEQIISTGEISRDHVMTIYNNRSVSYLERLPYNVFLNVIINGEITGKSLIDLCNSSPLINQQCNKPFKLENSDQAVPQYLFVLLLQKIGVNYEEVKQKKPNISPRDVYFYYTVGDGVSYRRLTDKLVYIDENYNEDWVDVENLFELLYEDDSGKPAFLKHITITNNSVEYNRFLYASREVYAAQDPFDNELLSDLDEAAERLDMTTERLLYGAYHRKHYEDREKKFHQLFPGVDFTFENYMEIVQNYPEYFRQFLLSIPDISDHYTLFNEIGNIVNNINQHMEEDENVDRSKLLDDQDIEYLIRLHLRILSGELNISTKFKIDDLIPQ